MKGFYIFCDESVKKDRLFSNFYGGALIEKSLHEGVNNLLVSKKQDLGLEDAELKWSQINAYRIISYCEMMDTFFELIKQNVVKLRIMFTDNRFIPTNLNNIHRENEYHILYYQFIKHAFGFKHLISDEKIDLEFFLDWLPDKKEKNENFKKFIYGLQYLPEFLEANLTIKMDSIYEVDSKKHILLQCLDVVLGAMAFRLNQHHKDKSSETGKRGKRTLAKEAVYKHIQKRIAELRPNFNIGISTGTDGDLVNLFAHPYRHWLFIPSQSEITSK